MLRISRLWLTVMVVVFVSIAANVSIDTFANAKADTPAGLIAFDSNRSGNPEIYVMYPDGSGLSQLTNNPANDRTPDWSPDGKHIVFSSERDGRPDLYVMNANGSGVKRLTITSRSDENVPAWSPDGKKIAYFLSVYDGLADTVGPSDIFVMNADGSKQALILDSAAQNLKLRLALTWSPDSKKIAFDAQKNGKTDLFVMNADGSNLKQLTTSKGANFWPAWSPDGKKIAYMSSREIDKKLHIGVYVANSDNSNEKLLTGDDVFAAAPSWSPDGKHLVYTVFDSTLKLTNIYVMDADGSNTTQLTHGDYLETYPSWSSAAVSLKLPLPTVVPQPTPKGSTASCPMAPDKTYGYSEDNPINVGGGDFDGPSREDDYLAQLRGPKGEEITYERTGSFPRESDGVILDIYVITYTGHSQQITLYVNEYSDTPPLIPVGFSCVPAK